MSRGNSVDSMPTRTKMPRTCFFKDTVRLLSPSPEDLEYNSDY